MPGIKLLTRMDPATCLKLAWRTAQDLGYSLTPTPLTECAKSFTAQKGTLFFSMLAGPFAPHCHFRIFVESYSDANELVLEANTPWLTTGAVGVSRVRQRADELMQAVGCAIEKDGGTVVARKEF